MRQLFMALSFFAGSTGFAQRAFVGDSLDAYVQQGLNSWRIPGVAVCVVKEGKVVWMKGYGLSEWKGEANVNEHTLFGIGSNTKAFTGTALAMLEADKKLSLDDKVQRWLPGFRLHDAWVSKEATVRDLLCHRLGFETFQGDFMYFDSDLSKEAVLQKFGQVKPLYGFRSRWGYTNAAFLAAGEVLARASGLSWSEFMEQRIFRPLGMSRTISTSAQIKAASNISKPHTLVADSVMPIAYGRLDNMAPAGAIYSSVHDLSKWLLVQLNKGSIDGKVVIAASAIGETHTPQSILGNGGHPFNRSHFALYGLGWFMESYAGRKVLSHTGGVNGFVTSVALVPEENLGIVVLTNTDANQFYETLRTEIMDAFLNLPFRNYSQIMLERVGAYEKEQKEWLQKKRDTVAAAPRAAVPIQALAGRYRHPVYGWMDIQLEGGKAVARFQHHSGRFATLGALGGNRYFAQFNEALFGNKVWPVQLRGGRVESITVTVADFVEFTPYVFTKIK